MKKLLCHLIAILIIAAGLQSCSSGKQYLFSLNKTEPYKAYNNTQSKEIIKIENNNGASNSEQNVAVSASIEAITPVEIEKTYTTEITKTANTLAKNQVNEVSLVKKVTKAKSKVFNKIAKENKENGGGKSQVIALILALLLGGLGIHRFYLGYTVIGIVQLLTFGGCGIWALIDIIRIITGDLQPKDGTYDKTL